MVPAGPPPSYNAGGVTGGAGGHPQINHLGPEKPHHYDSTDTSSDAALARRLQAEENARLGPNTGSAYPPRPTSRGAADDYYGGSSGTGGVYPSGASNSAGGRMSDAQPAEKRGLFSKLTGAVGGGRPPQPSAQYQPQGGYYGQGQPQQQHYGQPGMMGGGMGMGGMGGMQQGGYYQQQPQYVQQAAPQRHGMGMGGAAMGIGGGLLGGMLRKSLSAVCKM